MDLEKEAKKDNFVFESNKVISGVIQQYNQTMNLLSFLENGKYLFLL